eukprot:8193020-Alexandrium_andersonii.AAC.1
MSASLVGSEMCIRDRLLNSCASAGYSLSQADVGVVCTVVRCLSQASVSYTHLTLPTICSV